jgi:hypothetical protein
LKKNKLGGLLLITSKKLPKHLQSSKQINDSQTGKTMNSSHGMHDRVNISQVSQKHQAWLEYLRNFSLVFMDNCVSSQNEKFGMGVISFYGMLVIGNSHFSDNETQGILFSSSMAQINMLQTQE